MEDPNWVYVNGLRYQKLDCVGRGGSSKVFKVGWGSCWVQALAYWICATRRAPAIDTKGVLSCIVVLTAIKAGGGTVRMNSHQ